MKDSIYPLLPNLHRLKLLFMTNSQTVSPFLNRELGLIEFNRRVLAQAGNKDTPLLERLKFLCIVSSNLDEFFEVRVAGLKEQITLDTHGFGPDGMLPHQVFKRVASRLIRWWRDNTSC